MVLDSGSCCSIIQPGIADYPLINTGTTPYGVTDELLDVKGAQVVNFQLGKVTYSHTFLNCSLPTNAAGIIGIDFLESTQAILNFENSTLHLNRRVNQNLMRMIRQKPSCQECVEEKNGLITHSSLIQYPDSEGLVSPTNYYDSHRKIKIHETESI
jgi:hypothetical protein